MSLDQLQTPIRNWGLCLTIAGLKHRIYDRVAPPADTTALVNKLHEQKGITITHQEVEGAGHFFEDPHMDTLIGSVDTYVRRRLTETTR